MRAHTLALSLLAGAFATTPAFAQTRAAPAAAASAAPRTSALAPGVTMTDPESRGSYVIGVNIGNQLKSDDLPIDPNALMAGIEDALASAKLRFTDDQIRSIVTQLQGEVQTRRQEKLARLGQTNRTEGDAFLKANAAKPGVRTLKSGLQYSVLKAGTGAKPKLTDTVACDYRGTLLDGTEFDNSFKRGLPINIGVSDVIKGWSEALQLMPVGSKWRLYVPSELAYGTAGKGVIGPNAVLIFDIELLSIKPKA